MANFYNDNKDLKFHLNHPLMHKLVSLKERNFLDKELYDYSKDPLEKVNVYNDKNYAATAKEMYNKMITFFKSQ